MAIEDGRLKIGGCDVVQLAKEFGTPLYVVDEAMFRSRCREYRAGLSAVYPKSRVIYTGKALLNVGDLPHRRARGARPRRRLRR